MCLGIGRGMLHHCYHADSAYYTEEWMLQQWHQWHQQQQEDNQWAASVRYQQQAYHQWAYCQRKARRQQLKAEEAQLQQQIEEDTKRRLMKFKAKYERVASEKFSNALKIVIDNELPKDLKRIIERAIFFFDYEGKDSSPRGAVDAIRETKQAKVICEPRQNNNKKQKTKNKKKTEEGVLYDDLYKELDSAEKNARDALSVRTQLLVPMGDKKKYLSVLEDAYGEKIDDEENSRLMQSYRICIWEEFPGAFPSSNKKTNLQRGGKKRPGKPQRNLSLPEVVERNEDEEIYNINFSCDGSTALVGPIIEEDYEDDEDEEEEAEDVDEDETDEEDEE